MMQAGIQIAGLATSIFGQHGASQSAGQIAHIQQTIGQIEIQQNALREQQMTLSSQRQQTENLRNVQRARAAGLATAVGQGAQYGSGLAGAQGAASSQGAYNALGFSQNYSIGQQMFGLDSQIDQYRMQLAGLQGQMNTNQGISMLGSDITRAAQPATSVLGSFGGMFKGMGGPQSGGILGWQ